MSFTFMRPNVLITAGGTTEYIDNVRVMSNVSTGKTGARIAEMFLANGWNVQYVHGRGSEMPRDDHPDIQFTGSQLETYEVVTAKDAEERIRCCAGDADAVIMCMAVSDFTFDLDSDVKLDSSDADGFIEFLGKTIKKNVKILPQIREWNPRAYIMGFKYTVGESVSDQINIARKQIEDANINATFVNDDVEMKKRGQHCGMIIEENSKSAWIDGRESIAYKIYCEVNGRVMTRLKDYVSDFATRPFTNPFNP